MSATALWPPSQPSVAPQGVVNHWSGTPVQGYISLHYLLMFSFFVFSYCYYVTFKSQVIFIIIFINIIIIIIRGESGREEGEQPL